MKENGDNAGSRKESRRFPPSHLNVDVSIEAEGTHIYKATLTHTALHVVLEPWLTFTLQMISGLGLGELLVDPVRASLGICTIPRISPNDTHILGI